jgi:hypothetical protein
METNEVIRKHEESFIKVRRLLQFLLYLIAGLMIFLQHENIVRFFKWIADNI